MKSSKTVDMGLHGRVLWERLDDGWARACCTGCEQTVFSPRDQDVWDWMELHKDCQLVVPPQA